MGTKCASHIADLVLFCYEIDFMASLSGEKQTEIIQTFNSTSGYLDVDDLLNIDNPYFEGMVNRIYPPELPELLVLTKLTRLILKPHFWIYIYQFQTDLFHPKFMTSAMTLNLTLKIFLFMGAEASSSTSNWVYISQLIRFARVSSHVTDFNVPNINLTHCLNFSKQRYR